MINELLTFYKNIKNLNLDYTNVDKYIDKIGSYAINNLKYELSLKHLSNEKYILNVIKKEKMIEDEIKFIYYLLIEYGIKLNEMILYGNKEMNVKKAKNIKYVIIKTDNKNKLNLFRFFLRIFHIVDPNPVNYLGIDFEFNTKIAALIQLCFEGFKLLDEDDIYSFIFIFDPNQLNSNDMDYLINNYFINDKYYKLLHGAESLDIPYMFTSIFKDNNNLIKKFCKYYIDTRYLCEYYNKEKLDGEKKCKIYYALLNTGVLSKTQFDNLKKNEEEMGPIYDIKININNINTPLLKYTLYDVLFLKQFFFKFIYNEDNSKNKIYLSVIPELTQYIILEKRGIINNFSFLKEKIDKSNNNYLFIKNKFYKLITIFKMILPQIELKKINIKFLLEINYYRTFLLYLVKLLVYNNCIENYTVYKVKNVSATKLIDIHDILINLMNNKFVNINIFIINIKNKIDEIISRQAF
jgi:hypothetical protein